VLFTFSTSSAELRPAWPLGPTLLASTCVIIGRLPALVNTKRENRGASSFAVSFEVEKEAARRGGDFVENVPRIGLRWPVRAVFWPLVRMFEH
jgi:hypothetical protein